MTIIDARTQTGIRSAAEIFRVFLKLGLTSFGGPVAHLGYFRQEIVVRRQWLSEADYAELVAVSQFLPGPASSKVGFTLGLMRARSLVGGLAAWLGFTLPSALVLFALARGSQRLQGDIMLSMVHGLKLVAVIVVAHAVWGMMRTLTPDAPRIAIGLAALAMVLFLAHPAMQLSAIGLGLLAGRLLCRRNDDKAVVASDRLAGLVSIPAAILALCVFAALLALSVLALGPATDLFGIFYRAGAVVFGGGHVLLPLLEAELVGTGRVTAESFLTGYGLTQAMPGPLFTFAAWLGTVGETPLSPATAAGIALVAVFLPGLLLAYGVLPFWSALRRSKAARAALRGGNAAVVGILAAALYDPVWTEGVTSPVDSAIVFIGLCLLAIWRLPPVALVAIVCSLSAVVGFWV